uniref:Uncharacterized protein n=1 Tax=Rhizophagus irregularis (strain DAOM 181602 / DAOM 197198 / MUCL 43194) TaxID=747089 RepID=U9USF9_RHIID
MFKIWDCHSLLNDILLSLEFQKHSLVYVEFTACDFSNLKELSFKLNYWNVDVTSLMIKYLGASLQRLLVETPTKSLIENISIYSRNSKFLKIVLNYIERSNNSLKVLGMMKLGKELNDEELKLLNLIKAKGVEIVHYNTIYHDLCKFAF